MLQIVFMAKMTDGIRGDIAIDGLEIKEGECGGKPG